jgi:hypothetical protein
MIMNTTNDHPFAEDVVVPDHSIREIEYDRWGRYANLPSLPQYGQRAWTRVTTLAKTLEDTYHLEQWKQRQILLGIKENPALLEAISSSRFDPASGSGKTLLNSLASQSMEEAGSFSGADAGTAFHDLSERLDAGLNLGDISDDQKKMVRAYDEILGKHSLIPRPKYTERVVCAPSFEVAGRVDRIISHHGELFIGDVKTQKSLDFGQMSLAVQLAAYASAPHILDHNTWEWERMPKVNQNIGLIIWIPANDPGRAEIHNVDIEFGRELAKASLRVRQWRKRKGIVTLRTVG